MYRGQDYAGTIIGGLRAFQNIDAVEKLGQT
jgi:hypothetical protein